MERIDIAKLLKDCPSGMELDSTMFDNLYFNEIIDDNNITYPIKCYIIADEFRTAVSFTKFGTYSSNINSKCVIFPKGKTTWEEFVPTCKFKDGENDIIKDDMEEISKADTTFYIYSVQYWSKK